MGKTPVEEEVPFLADSNNPRQTKLTSGRKLINYGLLLGLLLSLFFNVIFLLLRAAENLDAKCNKHLSQYEPESPIDQQVDIKYTTVAYNGSFYDETVYRGPPGRQVDDAWIDLGARSRHIIIPEDQAEQYGLDPGMNKLLPELGGGFPVLVEFPHHLHCLDLLRMSLWTNYPYYRDLGEWAFSDPEHILEPHVGHCLDILRQFIMCHADTAVFGSYWVRELDGPFVDFNTKHRCKNYGPLLDWVKEHEVPEGADLRVSLREGDIVLDRTP